MVTLEQVKLLETKVTKTIEYVKTVTEENASLKEKSAALSKENAALEGKLDSYQQRIDELEVLIKRFKEDQSRIEDGILSALDRLNQFEDAVENAITAPKVPEQQKLSPEAKPETKKKVEAQEKEPEELPESNEASENELDIF